MISQDFIYARPDAKEEAVQLYAEYEARGLAPLYYGGGSEIITMCRAGSVIPGAVIDLKNIPEANELALDKGELVIGGCATLRQIKDSKQFPLLGAICGRIADHTNQCRITLGGNLCATIIYRETAQALLLTDADIALFGPKGLRTLPMAEAFSERLLLEPGEFMLQARVSQPFLEARFHHMKKTGCEKIDYPLVSVSAIEIQGNVRIALSGYYAYPFRSADLEAAFHNRNSSPEQRLSDAMDCLRKPPLHDYQGSAAYRQFVLKQTLAALMEVCG